MSHYKRLKTNMHNDFSKSWNKKDNEDVKGVIEGLEENFVHSFSTANWYVFQMILLHL